MPRLSAYQKDAMCNINTLPCVIQATFGRGVRLSNPQVISLAGKDCGNVFTDETIPANKTVKLLYGTTRSVHQLSLTPIHNDKFICAPQIIYAPDYQVELCLVLQTIKATPLAEVGEAILSAQAV